MFLLAATFLLSSISSSQGDVIGIDGSSPPGSSTWTFGISQTTLDVSVDTSVEFTWNSFHALAQFPDQASFTSCDFTHATILKAASSSGKFTVSPMADGTTAYYGCNVASHCQSGLKRAVMWTSSVTPPPTSCTAHTKKKCKKLGSACVFKNKKCVAVSG